MRDQLFLGSRTGLDRRIRELATPAVDIDSAHEAELLHLSPSFPNRAAVPAFERSGEKDGKDLGVI